MTSFYDINLMGREFSNEDELYHEILTTIKRDPEVSPSDYVAVALNRFTPVAEGSHRYTAQVTYRVLRVQDGQILLPDKNLIGDSGDQISDDSARTVATELAIAKTDEVLQTELTRAIRTGERSVARDAIASSTSYLIRIDNLDSPTSVSGITRALRGAGFTISQQFRGAASTETITVRLDGKSGADVLAVLESQVSGFDVVSMDEHGTVLRNR